ncbi:acyltransferase family protein [Sphingomonas sp. Leaf17]|uniref:acyltransferase family protein n=1 Tax=Sphingomonas sp. Leaf17 TaxID=1735683 RepID=UPI000A692AA4|nr:acyltransferase [Sphingomonas sp. Leaf17]
MSELRALTGMRGIAAWFVVLYHIRLSIAGLPVGLRDVLAKGYLAVDFFFLLSGFVIWLSWGARLRRDGWRAVPVFLRRRVARIWPLHLVMLGLAVLLAGALALTGRGDPADYPWGELPLHIVLVQNWGFTDRLTWNDPAWSISTELAAYLLFPLLVMAIDWRRVATGWLVVVAGGLVTGLYLAMGDAPTLGTDIWRYGLVRCLFEFALGTVVCALWLRWRDRRGAMPVAIGVAAVVGVALIAGVPETLGVPALFAVLLLALALSCERAGNPLEARWMHGLGEVSYATYLGHFLLWVAFKLVFVADARAVPWWLVGLYLTMVLAASVLLYRWVERPAQRWINGKA